MKGALILVVTLLLAMPLNGDTVVRRLAIDVGASALNVVIAEVDTEKRRITNVLYEEDVPIAIGQDIQQSGNNYLSDRLRYQLLEAFEKSVQKAKELEVTEYTAVSTGSLQKASNSETVVSELLKKTGFDLIFIDPMEEARLSYAAASAVVSIPPQRLIVWDLGGGSMEMSAIENGRLFYYASDMGAVSFMVEVIRKIKEENPNVVQTANPLSEEQIKKAVELASESVTDIPLPLEKRFKAQKKVVVGIGSLAFLEVDKVGPVITEGALRRMLAEKTGKNDRQLVGDKYVGQEVTNLALVLGMMERLGFDQLSVFDIDLADGLLLNETYQKEVPKEETKK